MPDYLELTYIQVGLAALLILINAGISLGLRLGLEKSLAVASVRTIVQLGLIGIVLEWVFRRNQPSVVLAVILFMTVVAGLTAVSRLHRRYDGIWINTLCSMWISSWFVGIYALLFVFRGIEPWYQPQYLIPILGMILGNTLNGISIGLDTILDSFATKRREIESRLALGATRWEASRLEIQRAVRSGMIPIINSMMIVGLVSLPGMMTGQLLSGTRPVEAIKYQIAIMFLIASATALGTVLTVMLASLRLLNKQHQLEFRRIRQR